MDNKQITREKLETICKKIMSDEEYCKKVVDLCFSGKNITVHHIDGNFFDWNTFSNYIRHGSWSSTDKNNPIPVPKEIDTPLLKTCVSFLYRVRNADHEEKKTKNNRCPIQERINEVRRRIAQDSCNG